MSNNLPEFGERAFKHYVAGLHKDQQRAPVPWYRAGIHFSKSDIPRLEREIRAAFDCDAWFVEQGCGLHLPLAFEDCTYLLQYGGGRGFFLAHYSHSLWRREYNFVQHPWFDEYRSGVLALPTCPDFLRGNSEWLEAFPPKPLPGLDENFCWCPLR